MKPTRTTALILLLCLLLSCFAGCSGQERDEFPKTFVNGDNTYVASLVEPLPAEQRPEAFACELPPSAIEIESAASIIAKGVVSNIREVKVEVNQEPLLTHYFTLFDLQIEDCYRLDRYSGAPDSAPEKITVYWNMSSRDLPIDSKWPDRVPLEEGGEYYIFLRDYYSMMERYNRVRAYSEAYALFTEGIDEPLCAFFADYYLLDHSTLLIPVDSSEEFIEWAMTESFDSEYRANNSTRAFLDKGVFTPSALEEFLRAYGEETEIIRTPSDPDDASSRQDGEATPAPVSEATLVPDDASSRQDGEATPEPDDVSNRDDEETTPEPDDASARQGG